MPSRFGRRFPRRYALYPRALPSLPLLEQSPGLELYGFSVSGPRSADTINRVTVTITEHQSAGAQAPCTFQLWDSTTAQIGATQTGTQGTGSGNVSSAAFTGVTYAQLATLRVRIYGNAPAGSGYTESVASVSLTVNYTAALYTGLATGTGAAQAAVPAIGVSAGLATGTGAAPAGPFAATASAGLATGAGTAQPVTVPSGTNALAGLATGTGGASAGPFAATASAGLATAAGAAQPAVPAIGVSAGPATAAGAAQQPSIPVPAGLATGTGAANAPPQSASGTAGLATGTGAAQQPSIPVTAGLASSAGTAWQAGGQNAGFASGTGAAQAAVPAIGVSAGLATAAGTAQAAAIAASAGLASGAGAALAVPFAVSVTAGLATGSGTAWQAGGQNAGLATAAGAAQNATVTTVTSGGANAGLASGAGVSWQPGGQNAGFAAGAGAAQAAVPAIGVSAGLAAGAGAAQQPGGQNAGLATAAGAAQQPAASSVSAPVASLASGSGAALQPSLPAYAGLATGTGTAQPGNASGTTPVSSADSAHAVESAFYYILGTGDTALAAESAWLRVRGADKASAADAPLSAWPSSRDASGSVPGSAFGKPAAERAWWSGPLSSADASHLAAEGWKPFRFVLADVVTGLEVTHEIGIWTYVPVNVRLEGKFWRVTGRDEQGNEVILLEAERLDRSVLEAAERARRSWLRLVSSGDCGQAAERARAPVPVTCWVVPAVAVAVAVTAVQAEYKVVSAGDTAISSESQQMAERELDDCHCARPGGSRPGGRPAG